MPPKTRAAARKTRRKDRKNVTHGHAYIKSTFNNTTLWNMYGPTETTVWSTCWQVPPQPSYIRIDGPDAHGVNRTIWPGFTWRYWLRTRKLDPETFDLVG